MKKNFASILIMFAFAVKASAACFILTSGPTPTAGVVGSTVTATATFFDNVPGPGFVAEIASWSVSSSSNASGVNIASAAPYYDNSNITITWTLTGTPGTASTVTISATGTVNSCTATASFSATILPIELKSFRSDLQNDVVSLEWSTASELQNDHFSVERSFDGTAFEMIGNVRGAGTTNEEQRYSFVDDKSAVAAPGKAIYYRLVQTDFDGKTQLAGKMLTVSLSDKTRTAIIGVRREAGSSEAVLDVQSPVEQELDLMVFDMSGRLVQQHKINAMAGLNQQPISFDALSSGVYSISLRSSVGVSTVKLSL